MTRFFKQFIADSLYTGSFIKTITAVNELLSLIIYLDASGNLVIEHISTSFLQTIPWFPFELYGEAWGRYVPLLYSPLSAFSRIFLSLIIEQCSYSHLAWIAASRSRWLSSVSSGFLSFSSFL